VNREWHHGDTLSSLESWKGYLIFNGYAGSQQMDQLSIPATEYTQVSGKRAASFAGTEVGIRVGNSLDSDGMIAAAFNKNLRASSGNYPKPDFFPKPLQIYFTGQNAGGIKKYLTDFRGEMDQGYTWTFYVENRTERKTMRLEFTGLDKLPDGLNAVQLTGPGAKSFRCRVLRSVIHTEKPIRRSFSF
jgi:hypothetical protein